MVFLDQYKSTYLAYEAPFAMKPITYKLDIEAALSMADLRAIYTNNNLAQDMSESEVTDESYDSYDDEDDEDTYKPPTIGRQVKDNLRQWARGEKEDAAVGRKSYSVLYDELFKKLANDPSASSFNPKGSFKNRKNAPYRVFFDLAIPEVDKGIILNSKAYQELNDYLRYSHRLFIVDYVAGLAEKVVFTKQGHKRCTIRIGKFLASLKDNDKAQTLLKTYVNDPNRQLKNGSYQTKLMISRSPLDVLGATTTDSWESCLNLHPARGIHQNSEYTPRSIDNGQMVAFLVRVLPPKKGHIDPELKFVGRKLIYPAFRIPKKTNELLYELNSKRSRTIFYELGQDYIESLYDKISHSKVLENLKKYESELLGYLYSKEALNFPLFNGYKVPASKAVIALVLGTETYGTWTGTLSNIVNRLLTKHHNAAFDEPNPGHIAFVPLDLYFRPYHFVKFVDKDDGYLPLQLEGLDEDDFIEMFAPEDDEEDYYDDDEDDEEE